MGYPVWQVPSGDLGKISSTDFFNYELHAVDPDQTEITFAVISGELPPGLRLNKVNDQWAVNGLPTLLIEDIEYTFVIRATAVDGLVTDQSFTVTVVAAQPPSIGNTTNDLGSYYDGNEVSIDLTEIVPSGYPITWSIIKGHLPPGLSIDAPTGIISGVIEPFVSLPRGASTGWENSRWEEYEWQFTTLSQSKTYEFTAQLTDGVNVTNHSFYIAVQSSDKAGLDRLPVLLTKSLGEFDTVRSNSYYAFQFKGVDWDAEDISYGMLAEAGSGFDPDGVGFDTDLLDKGAFALPPGLTLDPKTGWLAGFIPPLNTNKATYDFGVQVYTDEGNVTVSSSPTVFSMTVTAPVDLDVTWNPGDDLGTIAPGTVSTLYVSAVSRTGASLVYSLYDGNLPPGLQLNADGTISGRVSYQTTSFDKGTTTFDVASRNLKLDAPTTYDKTYYFTALATNQQIGISAQQTFKLVVTPESFAPKQNLYVECLPSLPQREIVFSILQNSDIFPYEDLYRPNDAWWGSSRMIRFLVDWGINANEASTYIAAMQARHADKKFYFGDYKWAWARDNDGTVLYEVVYVDMIETTRSYKPDGTSVEPSAQLDMRATPGWKNPAGTGSLVRPNDITLMQRDIDAIGFNRKRELPLWMRCVQPEGTVLGYKPAAVLAYMQPGTGKRALFNLNNRAPYDIKLVSFQADRYLWDCTQSSRYDATTNSYTGAPMVYEPPRALDRYLKFPKIGTFS